MNKENCCDKCTHSRRSFTYGTSCDCGCHATVESNFDKQNKAIDEAAETYHKKGDQVATVGKCICAPYGVMGQGIKCVKHSSPTVESWEKERAEVQSIVFRSGEAALEVVTANGVVVQVIHNGQSLPLST